MNRRNLLAAAIAAPFAGLAATAAPVSAGVTIGKAVHRLPRIPHIQYEIRCADLYDPGKVLRIWEDGRLVWEAPTP